MQTNASQAAQELEKIIEEVRVFSQGLHPALLARAGLGPSLRELAQRSPIPVEIEVLRKQRFPEATETEIYHVVSESLANAAKHSEASQIRVTVRADSDLVTAEVVDDGIGGAVIEGSSGLIGLVDRVEALGGRLVLESHSGTGTAVTIQLPLDADRT